MRRAGHGLIADSWLLAAFFATLPLCHSVFAQVPHLVRYQGRAVDSNNQGMEGPYPVIFRLYDAQTGGNLLWQEVWDDQAQPPTQDVVFTEGHFSVLLGSFVSLSGMDWGQPRWLGVEVDMDPQVNEELTPRQQMTSVPLALMAEKLDGPITTVADDVGIGTSSPSSHDGAPPQYNHILNIEGGSVGSVLALSTTGDNHMTKIVFKEPTLSWSFGVSPGAPNGNGQLEIRNSQVQQVATFTMDGKVSIGTINPPTILSIGQGSTTDPIADSWTVYSTSQSKAILGPASGQGYLDQLKAVALYDWRRAPLISDQEAQAALAAQGNPNPSQAEIDAIKPQLAQAKAQLPKFTAQRIGLAVDDPNIPPELIAWNPDGTKMGLDLLGYVGYLHAALKEAAARIEALEAQVNGSGP